MKRVYIVHGWGGTPTYTWLPWLKQELEAKGYVVDALAMPDPDKPDISEWTEHLSHVVGMPDEETVFVGHSVGCQTILRYIETLADSTRIAGAVFVGGWFTVTGLESEEDKAIAKPWLETPIPYEQLKERIPKIVAILSDNDPYVPLEENIQIFKEKLNATIITLQGKGHIDDDAGVKELPEALQAVLDM